MQFRVLGPLEVESQGRLVPIAAAKERTLLALLLLRANAPVSRDRLIDELWGESPPPTARHTLEAYVSRLRRTLTAAGDGAHIETQPGGYLFRVGGDQLDALRFERLVGEGKRALRADPREADLKLTRALELWRGDVLGDLALDVGVVEASRLEELHLEALELRVDARLELGLHRELVAELTPLVAAHPLRERFRSQLMLALYRSGRQADALEEFRRARRRLVEELGIEPGAELQQLQAAILRQDPVLAGPPPPAGPGPRRTRRRLSVVLAVAALASVAAIVPLLVGRGEEALAVDADSLGVVDAGRSRVEGQIDVGFSPMRVATAQSSIWVTNLDEDTVSRIDPETQTVRQTIGVGDGPDGVAAGDGFVWVANSMDGTLAKISPRTNAVVDRIQVGAGPRDVVAGLGSVWTANTLEHTISRIDPRSDRVVATFASGGTAPTALALGSGSLWVANASSDVVSRLDPRSGRALAQIPVGGGPSALAWGHGSLWVTSNDAATVTRIDPSTNLVVAAVPVGGSPGGLAVSADAVWVGDEERLSLARVDPAANTVGERIELANRPEGIAALGDRLYVAVRDSGRTHRGGTLTAVVEDVSPLDPADAGGGDRYDCLVRCVLPGAGPLKPDLAAALPRPTDGGRTYRFALRSGIRFSNGEPLRPSDVAHTVTRLFRLQTYASMLLEGVVGGPGCVRAPARCDLSRGVVADDAANTVTFHLAAPDPAFLEKLAFVMIVPSSTPFRRLEEKPIPGTGPYMVAEYRPGRVLRLVRNPHFRVWAPDVQPDGFPDEIVSRLDVAPSRWLDTVLRGEADVTNPADAAQLREATTQHPHLTQSQVQPSTTTLIMNTDAPPFDDVRVRRAVNFAVDRAALARLYPSGGAPTCQWLPPNFPAYRRYCPYTLAAGADGAWVAPDLEKARMLVDASGTRGMRVTFWAPANEFVQPSADYVVSLLRRLGYRADLKHFSNETYLQRVTDPRLQIAWGWHWFPDFPTPAGLFTGILGCGATPSSMSPSRVCDGRLRTLAERASARDATDPAAAVELWTRVDHELVDAAGWVWLYNLRTTVVFSERVGNRGAATRVAAGPNLPQLWVR